MKRLSVVVIVFLAICGLFIHRRMVHVPKPRMKAPTTRYHGYELNHLAISQAKAFTVLISNEGFGGVGRGTGVLIDSMHVLTCAHMVIGPYDDLWIFPYPAGNVVKGKPVLVNRNVDLAVLELDKAVDAPYYATFQPMHYDGEPITIIGNTLGSMKWFVSFGIVSGEWENFILTDGTLYGGNSGGPWINEQGEVVALSDWTWVHKGIESGIHGGIAASTIEDFLKAYRNSSAGLSELLFGGK